MNSYERVMGTLQGQSVDRPPVLAPLGAMGGRLTGVSLPELYQNPKLFIRGQRAVQAELGFDLLLGSFDYSLLAEAFGGEPRFFEEQPPNLRRPAANSVAEALELPLPDPLTSARLPAVLDAVQELSDEFRGQVPVAAALPGPGALPVMAMGLEAWMDALLFDEPNAVAMLERTSGFWVKWANGLLDAGADFLIVTEGLAAQEILTRDVFEQRILPHDRACFERARGPLVFHHTGGRIHHVLDLIRDLPNLAAVMISSKDDVDAARERLGPGVALLGNLDNLSLPTLAPEALREAATRAFEEQGPMGPRILAVSGADVPMSTPLENLHAILAASREYGATNPVAPRPPRPRKKCVACAVFRDEMEHLKAEGLIDADVRYLTSRLHMKPEKLGVALERLTEQTEEEMLLVYGDCCSSMLQIAEKPGISRIPSLNCCQLFLGTERYRELLKEGAFFVLPEWAHKWRTVIADDFGMDVEVAREFMQEQCTAIVYLDTGTGPVPHDELQAFSDHVGLPWNVEPVGMEKLREALQASLGSEG